MLVIFCVLEIFFQRKLFYPQVRAHKLYAVFSRVKTGVMQLKYDKNYAFCTSAVLHTFLMNCCVASYSLLPHGWIKCSTQGNKLASAFYVLAQSGDLWFWFVTEKSIKLAADKTLLWFSLFFFIKGFYPKWKYLLSWRSLLVKHLMLKFVFLSFSVSWSWFLWTTTSFGLKIAQHNDKMFPSSVIHRSSHFLCYHSNKNSFCDSWIFSIRILCWCMSHYYCMLGLAVLSNLP